MKRRVWLGTIYFLIVLGVGFIAAINVPTFQMPMLMIFGGLLAVAVLVVGGLLLRGVEYFLFDRLPSFVSRRIHGMASVFGWLALLSLPILAILVFIQLPETRPLLALVTFGLAIVALVVGGFYGMQRLDSIGEWLDLRITNGVIPLANLYLELSYNARFYTKRHEYAKVATMQPGANKEKWRTSVVAVLPDYVGIYPLTLSMNEAFTFRAEQLRWLGRPRRFNDTESELWLDVEVDARWYTLRIRLAKAQMKRLYDALREFLSSEQGMVGNWQRPNLRQQPVNAKTAAKGEAVQLYLTPLHLVILREGNVQRAIALDDIEQVSVSDASQGVEFAAQGRQYAFTLEGHQAFGEALAKATRFTPETPEQLEDGEAFVVDDEASDDDFFVTDDGEIERRKG